MLIFHWFLCELSQQSTLTVVHNFWVLVGFKESGVVPKILAGPCRQRPPGSIFHIKTNEKSTFLPRPCPLGAGLVPGPSGSPWGRPGVLLGSSWGAPGVVLGSSWGAPGVVLGSSWGAPWGAPWGSLRVLGGPQGDPGIPWGDPWIPLATDTHTNKIQILIQIRYRYRS